ncbi:hypothetical protein [Streptomyces sp. NPDC053431]|uniref:lipase/acyltransferase domain-containing protein n=1 Tax=Streptomyces sp. NPDC053431 TaxID=3365703 RepID=UPI0037D0B83F
MSSIRRFYLLITAFITALIPVLAGGGAAHATPQRAPIVLFPAFHFTKLQFTVKNQQVDASCPASGTFEDFYPNPAPSTTFSQVCRDKLMTLSYNSDPALPMAERFSNPTGVTVAQPLYGKVASAPAYDVMFNHLEAEGWVLDQNVRVAGYDARLTPDMDGFIEKTKQLIEDTYADNGHVPVHLAAHSNGANYAQYLLTKMTPQWKAQYIHGFTPIAGNWPGQGLLYTALFTGLNINDTFAFPVTSENASSSAQMYLSAPSSYMSAASPAYFGDQVTVIADASTGTEYTPADFRDLLDNPGMPDQVLEVANHYLGFLPFQAPGYPNVDVFAEKASGISTLVGVTLPDLTVGQVLDFSLPLFIRDGDGNQEDITNDAIAGWSGMACHKFEMTNTVGVDHFALPSDSGLLNRLVTHALTAPSNCPA